MAPNSYKQLDEMPRCCYTCKAARHTLWGIACALGEEEHHRTMPLNLVAIEWVASRVVSPKGICDKWEGE